MKEIREYARKFLGMKTLSWEHRQFINEWNNMCGNSNNLKMYYNSFWCACFVSYCMVKCNLQNVPLHIRVTKMIEQAKEYNLWIEDDNYIPKSNDLIIFEWNDNGINDCNYDGDHIGIVDSIKDGYIYTIEGNFDNQVKTRKIKINDRYIRGFINISKLYNNSNNNTKTDYEKIAREVIRGKYGNGQTRKDNLKKQGYTDNEIVTIQNIVNDILR